MTKSTVEMAKTGAKILEEYRNQESLDGAVSLEEMIDSALHTAYQAGLSARIAEHDKQVLADAISEIKASGVTHVRWAIGILEDRMAANL
jgi:hypothetical protein